MSILKRCQWVDVKDPTMFTYHDKEWGVPIHNDDRLFEALSLEGAQAGLSWKTILHRRDAYRAAFANFNVDACAAMTDSDLESICVNTHVVRHRLKIFSVRHNAQVVQALKEKHISFTNYVWQWIGTQYEQKDNMMPQDCNFEIAARMSKDLKKAGMLYVGPTIMHSFMQAVGMINDHEKDCFLNKLKI